MKKDKQTMERIVALCKNRGYIFPGSDIYGGLANTWDYGPLGVEFKNNLKQAWWEKFIKECPYNVGIDTALLMNPAVWVASGHVGGFSDPLMDCKECKTRFRADQLIEDYAAKKGLDINTAAMQHADMERFIAEKEINCPACGRRNFTGIRKFNLMFKTFQGVTEDSSNEIFLRPETAQGIFVNFKNVQRTTRKRLPFGIGQIGKSFRNEITPGNFTFRTREFEQMELEFFCAPAEEMQWFTYWKDFCYQWLLSLGMTPENIKLRDHSSEELSHYSNATTDVEYLFPFGWGELWGIADRTDFDLKQHMQHSGENLEYTDPVTGEKFLPYCIEPSLGADRGGARVSVRRVRRGTAGKRDAYGTASLSGAGALQSGRAAAAKTACGQSERNLYRAAERLHGRHRHDGQHRQTLPPPGRDRHAALHHGRFRHAGRRHRHGARPRHDAADPHSRRACRRIHRGKSRVLAHSSDAPLQTVRSGCGVFYCKKNERAPARLEKDKRL